MSLKNRLAFKNVLAILLVTTLTPLIVMAQEVAGGAPIEGNVGKNSSCSEASEAEQYWTPERMENAQPLPMRRPGSPKPVSQPVPTSSPEVSAPSSSPTDVSQQDIEQR